MGSLSLLRRCYHANTHPFRRFNFAWALCKQRMCATASHKTSTRTFLSPTEQSTIRLAAYLAKEAEVKDCICLYGDVGAGKSVFRYLMGLLVVAHSALCCALCVEIYSLKCGPCSRAFIRAIAGDHELTVPSPTYLLQNTYDDLDGKLCLTHAPPRTQIRARYVLTKLHVAIALVRDRFVRHQFSIQY
jgi:hypothetical protein